MKNITFNCTRCNQIVGVLYVGSSVVTAKGSIILLSLYVLLKYMHDLTCLIKYSNANLTIELHASSITIIELIAPSKYNKKIYVKLSTNLVPRDMVQFIFSPML